MLGGTSRVEPTGSDPSPAGIYTFIRRSVPASGMNPLPLVAESGSEVALPTTLVAGVVLVVSLLIVVGWLAYLYR